MWNTLANLPIATCCFQIRRIHVAKNEQFHAVVELQNPLATRKFISLHDIFEILQIL